MPLFDGAANVVRIYRGWRFAVGPLGNGEGELAELHVQRFVVIPIRGRERSIEWQRPRVVVAEVPFHGNGIFRVREKPAFPRVATADYVNAVATRVNAN